MAWTDVGTFAVGQVLDAATMNALRGNQNIGHRVCTSSTRPSTPDEGTMIYETDTKKVYVWDGSEWGLISTPYGAWTPWTPNVLNCTLGNGQLNCVYNKIGRQVTCRIMFQHGSTTSVTGPLDFELPFTAVSWGAGYHIFSSTGTLSSGATRYLCIPWSTALTYVRFTAFGGSGTATNTGDVSGTFPKTLVSGDQINSTFTYESTT